VEQNWKSFLLKWDRGDKSKNDIDELIIAFYDICTNKAIYKQKSSTDSEIVVLFFFVTLKILAKEGQLAICQLLTLRNKHDSMYIYQSIWRQLCSLEKEEILHLEY